VAYGLGTVPVTLQPDQVRELKRQLADDDEKVEWIVAAVAMFGSFNKLMDGLGVPLEPDTYAETADYLDSEYSIAKAGAMMPELHERQRRKPPPAVDDWMTKLAVIYNGL